MARRRLTNDEIRRENLLIYLAAGCVMIIIIGIALYAYFRGFT